jgi:hypothetical protein
MSVSRVQLDGDRPDRAGGCAGAASVAGLAVDKDAGDAAGGEREADGGLVTGVLATTAGDPLG